MSTTTNLLATKIETQQSQKEVTANDAFDVFDKAIAGRLSQAITTADLTLTTDQARNAIIDLTGALTGNRNLIVPTRAKMYLIANNTTAAFSLTVKTAAGTGVTVPQGGRAFVFCDGTNVVSAVAGSATVATTATAGGTTTLDLSRGTFQDVTMGAGNTTIALSNVPVGAYVTITIIQDATGMRAVTWPATVKWAGGMAPVLSVTANARDQFTFRGNGTNLYAQASALNLS